MSRVLLVNLPFYRLLGSHYNGLNLGLAYITSVLNENGHCCKIYNADYMDSEKYANQKEIIQHYKEYKDVHKKPDHPVWKETVETILKFNPDFVGFSIFTADVPAAVIVAALLKKARPELKIMLGGPHASLAKELLLKESPCFDYVVYGEGEFPALKIVSGEKPENINNLIWRKGSEIIVNERAPLIENLDILPIPDRKNYYPENHNYISHFVMTSRGCPNNCTFCASPVIWDRKVRFRGVDNIMEELFLLKKQGFSEIQFIDDTFTFRKPRLMELLNKIIESGLGFKWLCDTRLNCLDEEILTKMKESGCIRVKVGIESGNKARLKEINKGITPEFVLEKTKLIRDMGMSFAAYFMIGFPGETDEEARETIELAKKVEADYYSLSICAPYYGTKIYEDFLSDNEKEDIKHHWEYFFHQSDEMALTSKISKSVVEEFLSLNEYGKGRRI